MIACGQGNINNGWYEESYNNRQSGPVNTATVWGMGECMEAMYDDMTTKKAREGILGAIRATMSGEFTMPDPHLDVSDVMMASMELGVRSVSWDMVKEELRTDGK